MKYRRDEEGIYVDYEPDGYVDITTWTAFKFIIKILFVVSVGTWLVCWLIWG